MLQKKILSPSDLPKFLQSDTCKSILSFVKSLCDSIRGTSLDASSSSDDASDDGVAEVVRTLKACQDLIDLHPPSKKSQRFGNKSFRDWYKAVSDSNFFSSRSPELVSYFLASFGNPTRLDFGTGHEAHFLLFMMCLSKLDIVSSNRNLVSIVFPAYVALSKRLQRTYNLEPAGSHGAWSLDDYHLLPFIFGAAQLDGNSDGIRVKSIRSEDVVDCYRDAYLFFNGVWHARCAKTGAPFRETCPMLYELSRARCDWNGLCSRLLHMFQGEVLGKYPVAQHFLFGKLISASWSSSTTTTAETIRHPMNSSLRKPVLDRYFGDVVSRASTSSLFERLSTSTTTTPRRHEILSNGIKISGWKITSNKEPLSGEKQMKEMEKKFQIDFPFPEMTFGANSLRLEHETSGTTMLFEPAKALRGCKLSVRGKEESSRCTMVKVPCAEKWENRVDAEGRPIRSISFNYDWTYTTFYEGTFLSGGESTTTSKGIDYEHLRRRDPILWNDDVVLYEVFVVRVNLTFSINSFSINSKSDTKPSSTITEHLSFV